MDVRSIIKEATSRINLVPRKQAVPGDILETAYRLLKGIVSKYNYDNLLNFTQNSVIVPNTEVTHIYDETDFAKGEYNMYFDTVMQLEAYELSAEDIEHDVWALCKESPNVLYTAMSVGTPEGQVYTWRAISPSEPYPQRYQQMLAYQNMQHVCVRDVAKINSVYLITPTAEPYKLHKELEFVPANKFDSYLNGAPVYTVTEKSEGEWIMRIKPGIALLDRRLKINYNESIEFDVDSDLYIPDNYTELLIVALAHKLALQFPRLDETQMNRLEQEVRILVDNVRTPKAITRSIVRNDYFEDAYHTTTPTELLTGYWF
jgi:hypothetical protein